MYDEMYEINRFRRLSQALVHFVIDRASLFTDHRVSGFPIRAKYGSVIVHNTISLLAWHCL